jgi:hypothetical protein
MILFIPVNTRAITINNAVKADLPITRKVLGIINKYCVQESGNRVIIEYWHDMDVAAKLIHADNPAKALMHHYNTERVGLVECPSVS